MKFVRFLSGGMSPNLGLLDGYEVVVLEKPDHSRPFSGLIEFLDTLAKSGLAMSDLITATSDKRIPFSELEHTDRLLVPVEAPEVWGCGVTYKVSMEAREFETMTKTIYGQVYLADRPEIFFKSNPSRYVGPNSPICIRSDSNWTVPEPELSFVIGINGEIFGYTIADDVSSRDIEGMNPLYLPQAKTYKGSCSFGPTVVTADEIGNPHDLQISMNVKRNGSVLFEKSTNTSRMKRTINELLEYLKRDNILPVGLVCMTGTGIVPPNDFTLQANDEVDIEIEKIGVLRNTVIKLG